MDVAAIVLTASSLIIILQVVSIILIVKNKKTRIEKPEAVPVQPAAQSSFERDFRKRREDNRFNRRPGFEQKQKPPVAPQPPQAVDYVEKSLRDINLKLKNAERDQENARKKLRDDVQGPQQQNGGQNQTSQRRFDNNQNRPNRGRGDDFRRRDRNDRRPPNNQFRDRDQNHSRDIEQERPFAEQPRPLIPESVNPPMNPPVSTPEQIPKPQIPIVSQPVVEKEPVAPVLENTEIFHGRKVLVRRRILTPEEQAAKDNAGKGPESAAAGSQESPAPSKVPAASESKPADAGMSQPPEDESAAEPIRFGR
jgi:hypothetical protein